MAIDHEKRRQDIAAIAIDLIAREGLEAATIRRIAADAGFSTTAITYYFADKRELLAWTFQVLSKEGEERFEEEWRRDPTDITAALLTMVPWCPVNVRRWKAYLAFWDAAARDAELAQLLARSTDSGMTFMRLLLRSRAEPHADIEKACQFLNAVVQGLALQMLVDPERRSPDETGKTLKEAFEAVLRLTDASP